MQDTQKRQPWLIRAHHRMRTASFAMMFVAISLEIAGQGYGLSTWMFLGFVFLIYPHVQLFCAYKAKNPVSAEMRNLIVDSILLGMAVAALGFPVWITFSVVVGTLSNNVANKGWRGLADTILALLGGIFAWIVIMGFGFSPATNLPSTILCIFGLTGYLMVIVNMAFTRNHQLRGAREALVQREKEAQNAAAELRVAAIAFQSQEGMFITDGDGVIQRVNATFTKITGYTGDEVAGMKARALNSGRQDADFYLAMKDSLRQTGLWQGELWNRRKSGEIYPEWLTITAVSNAVGKTIHYIGTLSDITQRKAAEDQIERLAFYDPLTQLPNRRLLQDRLQHALATGARTGRRWGVLFIDLDNFKTLNDTRGHDVGDQLLQRVAERLANSVREGDTIARLGGDEFVVMLEDLSEQSEMAANQMEAIGEKIIAALACPYWLSDSQYNCTASIGATLFDDHHKSIEELMKQADLAMYEAKASGRNMLRFFDPEMQSSVDARAALEANLRMGLKHQQFILHYQPQVDAKGRITGAETLIRWQHAERGLISPLNFIPLAEETGLILSLGQWVLETACTQLKAWEAQSRTAHLTLAVNVSARQFHHQGFVNQVLTILNQTGADPRRLKLELTESLLLGDVENIIVKMNTLKAAGIGFSLDDFGTGYSSLSYLKRLPLNQLKIDQSFVRDILTDPSDAAIARTIIALADSMGLDVIAEGVETDKQRQFLAGLNCHAFQGYLFGRPMPSEAFLDLIPEVPSVFRLPTQRHYAANSVSC